MSMNGSKTRKVLDVNVEGINFICIFDAHAKRNPYRLYRRWYDNGWHREKMEYYGNFVSVICWLKDYAIDHNWGFKEYFN